MLVRKNGAQFELGGRYSVAVKSSPTGQAPLPGLAQAGRRE